MKRIAYLRVSTAEQSHDRQIDGLDAWADELHTETVSAVSKARPVYQRVIRKLQKDDVLVVWSLDRAWRNTKDALIEIDRLKRRGVKIHIASMSIDTSSPFGKLIYTFVGALAEYERDVIRLRTKEGLAAARKRGKRLGRPPKISDAEVEYASKRILNDEATVVQISSELGVTPWTLRRRMKALETA